MSERCGRRRPRGGRSERPDIHLSVYLVFSVLEEAHRVCLSELHSAIAGELDENEMVADNRPRRHEVNGRVRQPTSKAVPASPGSGEAAAGEFHALLLGGGGGEAGPPRSPSVESHRRKERAVLHSSVRRYFDAAVEANPVPELHGGDAREVLVIARHRPEERAMSGWSVLCRSKAARRPI